MGLKLWSMLQVLPPITSCFVFCAYFVVGVFYSCESFTDFNSFFMILECRKGIGVIQFEGIWRCQLRASFGKFYVHFVKYSISSSLFSFEAAMAKSENIKVGGIFVNFSFFHSPLFLSCLSHRITSQSWLTMIELDKSTSNKNNSKRYKQSFRTCPLFNVLLSLLIPITVDVISIYSS